MTPSATSLSFSDPLTATTPPSQPFSSPTKSAPTSCASWGPRKFANVLEELITECRKHAPDLLYAYANFPTTEYLEPRNADFTAFNVYLEEQSKFESYLQRLHNIAGDRPLFLTEYRFQHLYRRSPKTLRPQP